MLRACFVCLPAASVINPALGGPIGGTETRAWLFARMLARRDDTQVTFVVRNRTPMNGTVDGVVIRTLVDRAFNLFEQVGLCVARRPGFPWLSVRKWQTRLLWQLPAAIGLRLLKPRRDPIQADARFQAVDCDVFCTFGVQSVSATVISSARAAGKPCVLVLGSDGDLDPKFLTEPDSINPYGDRGSVCRFILEQADMIVCQTQEQQRALKERFGRDGLLIENPIDLEDFDRHAVGQAPPAAPVVVRSPDPLVVDGSPDPTTPPDRRSPHSIPRPILWIGRAEAIHKRPMQAIEIARRVPELPFLLVMNPRDPAEETRVREAAPPNVSIVTHVPPPEMPALMARSAALLNTSSLEGFPNTFLQAAAARIPVVSLSVGDAFLEQSGAGVYCHDNLDRAAAEVRRLVAEPSMAAEMGNRGRAWVETHHAAAARAAELRNVLLEAVNRIQLASGL